MELPGVKRANNEVVRESVGPDGSGALEHSSSGTARTQRMLWILEHLILRISVFLSFIRKYDVEGWYRYT